VNHLATQQPEWLTNLIGPRPDYPEGRNTWRSTLTDITRHRLENGIVHTATGLEVLGPTNSDTRLTLQRRIGDTRRWLNEHPNHATTEWPIHPSRPALARRQREVDAILDTAPPDQRTTINQIRAGQLSLDDTQQLLATAVKGQSERQQWIVANWPHVVEAQEIDAALSAHSFGPDVDVLANAIEHATRNDGLREAARARAPWLAAALNRTSGPNDTDVGTHALDLLEGVASYRSRHRITSRDPLGPLPIDPEQRNIQNDLENHLDGVQQRSMQRGGITGASLDTQTTQEATVESPNSDLLRRLNAPNAPHVDQQPDLGIDR
jgi:hypothetical protein